MNILEIWLYYCLLCFCSCHIVIDKWPERQFRFIFSTNIYFILILFLWNRVSFRSSCSTSETCSLEHNRVIDWIHSVAFLLHQNTFAQASLYLHFPNLWFLPALQKYIETISTSLKSPWCYSGILWLVTMLCLSWWCFMDLITPVKLLEGYFFLHYIFLPHPLWPKQNLFLLVSGSLEVCRVS